MGKRWRFWRLLHARRLDRHRHRSRRVTLGSTQLGRGQTRPHLSSERSSHRVSAKTPHAHRRRTVGTTRLPNGHSLKKQIHHAPPNGRQSRRVHPTNARRLRVGKFKRHHLPGPKRNDHERSPPSRGARRRRPPSPAREREARKRQLQQFNGPRHGKTTPQRSREKTRVHDVGQSRRFSVLVFREKERERCTFDTFVVTHILNTPL